MSIEIVSPTITVSTTPAYTAGDLVGGKLDLSMALGKGNYSAELQGLVVVEKGIQKSALDIVFFNANPSATSFTDNTAFAVAAADVAKVIGIVSVAQADYISISTTLSVATIKKSSLRMVLKNVGSTSALYAAVIARGTPTYTTTTDLSIAFTICK
jgi:hypothetical protein